MQSIVIKTEIQSCFVSDKNCIAIKKSCQEKKMSEDDESFYVGV